MFACLHAPGNAALLVDCASHFSPLIEETSRDTVIFDIRGLRWIHGSPGQIAAAIRGRLEVEANLAIAANPDTAYHAAIGIAGTTVIAPGEEGKTLAPLGAYLLGGTSEFARRLTQWGVRTFGELAALPPLGVAARLGAEGTKMQQLARGEARRQLILRTDPLAFRAQRDLEHALHLLEPLLLILGEMAEDLCEGLRFHGRSTNELRLELKLAHRGTRSAAHEMRLRLPVPMLDAKVLLKLLELDLNGKPPRAAVTGIAMELMPVQARTTQHGLFLPAAPEPEKLEITLARIRNLVGEKNVGAAEMLNTHRPDAFRMEPVTMALGASVGAAPAVAKLALRRFRPPCVAQVWCTYQGQPFQLSSAKGSGKIVACAGPWWSSGDWWTKEPWRHQEWDIEVERFAICRLYRDHLKSQWYLAGVYD
jgi:protein ImuB